MVGLLGRTIRRLRVALGSAGLVLLLLGALSATAHAELPEIGRCVKGETKSHVYKDKNCSKVSKGGDTGAYEFETMPLQETTFENNSQRSRVGFTFQSAAHTIECGPISEGGIKGEFTGPQSMLMNWVLVCGEPHPKLSCWHPGEEQAFGIPTPPLTGRLGYIDGKAKDPTVGLQLETVDGSDLLELQCPGFRVTIGGSMVLEWFKPAQSASAIKLLLSVSGGHEVPEALEGSEPAAMTMTSEGVSEPAVVSEKKIELVNPSTTFEIKTLP